MVTEGEKHRRQRRIMVSPGLSWRPKCCNRLQNPAFGAPQVRELTEVFMEVSKQLCAVLAADVQSNDQNGRVNILNYLNNATLDIIGLGGFHYKFNALTKDAEMDELSKSLGKILNSSLTQKLITFARAMIPVLRWIVSRHDSVLSSTLLSSIQRMPADSDMIEAEQE